MAFRLPVQRTTCGETRGSWVLVSSTMFQSLTCPTTSQLAVPQGYVVAARPMMRPASSIDEAAAYGAHVVLVDGLINDAGRIVRENARRRWAGSTSRPSASPTAPRARRRWAELAEQLGWTLPDVDHLPDRRRHRHRRHVEGVRRAGGAGLDRPERPRMVSVQAEGCAPIVRAFEAGALRVRGLGKRPRRSRPACACRRRSATT